MDMEEQPAYGEIQETVDPMDAFADVPNGPSTDALTELENEFARTVAEKQEKENALTEERKEQAERDLDKFYDELTDKKAQKQAQNREHEELLRAATETQTSNPFEKVVQLIGGATDSGDGSDLQIMRSLLVRLKNDPKRSSEPKDDAEPAEAADPFASM